MAEQAQDSGVTVLDKRHQISEAPEEIHETNNAMEVFRIASQKNWDPEQVKNMMELAERYDQNIARKAYFHALANFKANAPEVTKDKYNSAFDSWYTSLGNLLKTFGPSLAENGLSISFPVANQDDKTMTVACRLTHAQGHFEEISMTSPIDEAPTGKESGKRSRNPLQDVKSTFTYLRSATCEAILGVAGTESTLDDDGNLGSKGPEYIDEEQIVNLQKKIKAVGRTEENVCEYFKVPSIKKLTKRKYSQVMNMLQNQKGKQS